MTCCQIKGSLTDRPEPSEARTKEDQRTWSPMFSAQTSIGCKNGLTLSISESAQTRPSEHTLTLCLHLLPSSQTTQFTTQQSCKSNLTPRKKSRPHLRSTRSISRSLCSMTSELSKEPSRVNRNPGSSQRKFSTHTCPNRPALTI